MKQTYPAVHSVFVLLPAVLLLIAPLTRAQVVANTAASGPGSLRAVVAAAAPGATITFAAGLSGKSISLGSSEILLNKNVTIDASALPQGIVITVLPDSPSTYICIFRVPSDVTVHLKGMTLWGGNGHLDPINVVPRGGAIYTAGNLTLTACTLYDNNASFGGAIYSSGTLTISQCTLTRNTAYGWQGTPGFGGAISGNGGSLTINQSTIAQNRASHGAEYGVGGAVGLDSSTTLYCFNSIVAGNYGFTDFGGVISNTNFLKGTNLIGGDPLLLPLGHYGGPTQTMPPRTNSPALNAGADFINTGLFGAPVGLITLFPTDQRGRPRLFGAHADIGAVELQSPMVVTSLADAGPGSLRQAVSNVDWGGNITFAPNLSGQSIQLASTLVLDKNLTIDASGLPAGIKLLGSGRVLEVTAGQAVAICALEVRNGYHASKGAGIYNAGTLTLDSCTISNNGAITEGNYDPDLGGGIYNIGHLTLNQCMLTGNVASIAGAAIYNQSGATLTVNNSTITGNECLNGAGGIRNNGSLTLNNTLLTGNTGGSSDPDLHNTGTLNVVVTTTADAVTGSLRERLASYPGAQAITFATNLSGQTLTLTGGEMVLNTSLAIDASAVPGGVTISGNGAARLFNIGANGHVTLIGLKLTNGKATGNHGGAIYNGGVLTVDRCTVADNTATFDGGGIFNPAGSQLTLLNSTLTRNTAREGGAVRCTGAAFAATNCTFTANTAGIGGACSLADGGPESQLSHLTIVGNQATDATYGGGGLFLYAQSASLENSIVAENTAPTGPDIRTVGSTLGGNGVNLLGNLSGSSLAAGPSVLIGKPLLAPLGNYGGPTPTMTPLLGSPVINVAGPTALTTDQRGAGRRSGAGVDIGAVEVVAASGVRPRLTGLTRLPNGALQFTFSNPLAAGFTVYAGTNVAAPMNTWLNLGPAVEKPLGSGQYQFTDPAATNHPQRFYRVGSP